METELINVPCTGTGGVPLISIGGAHKGVTYMRLDWMTSEEFYVNYNLDCIGPIFDRLKLEIKDSEKRGIDLKKAIYAVMKEIWDNHHDYSFTKCFSCYTKEPSPDDHCYCDTGWECIPYNHAEFPLTLLKEPMSNFCTYLPLRELDLRITGRVSLTCKIKNIQNPTISNGKYSQNVIVYDTDTNKTLKATFSDNVADFDKWKKGDSIRLIGVINNDFERPLSVAYAVKINNNEENVVINRNDKTPGYNDWRKKIIGRDGKCVCCGHDNHLEAHHLFGYKENPSLAVNESNGVTLCKFCHDKYHNIYGVKNINPVDFMNFIKRFGVR